MEKLTFNILGQEMNISIKEDNREAILSVLKFYRKRIQELVKVYPYKSHLEIAILAGLRIADEYSMCCNYLTSLKKEKNDNNIDKILEDLGKELDLLIK